MEEVDRYMARANEAEALARVSIVSEEREAYLRIATVWRDVAAKRRDRLSETRGAVDPLSTRKGPRPM